jgi:hypothetical protein
MKNTLPTLEPIPTEGLDASLATLDATIEAMRDQGIDLSDAPLVRTHTPVSPGSPLTWPQDMPATKETFVIDSERAANWYIRKMVQFDQEKATIKAQAAQRITELDADKSRLEFFYKGQLEAWAHEEAERRRRKTITLQNGTVKITTVPAHVKVSDQSAAIESGIFPDLVTEEIKTIKRIDSVGFAARALKLVEAGDSLPDGCEWIPTRESVSIKTAKEKEVATPQTEE